ncbi:class I SAM-dependent methyltransferase [Janthinobacterium sp.]|uniref:class I SAM-dependent methyltransferase n=1 Tax=Janthinobacterium sp. TaxID=1871054 RepID=UPI002638C286|nr:class I SAM-dependent methyltransferase [Janthinobacterium sp.]
MDTETLAAYNKQAAAYARDWREQDAPSDMYALLKQYFAPGLTADIGCGGGRDTAWLAANGFQAIGVDVSQGLLDEARAAYPGLTFQQGSLPALDGLQRGAYQNVLCETVIMHLEPASISEAVSALISLLLPGGTLYLSWRVTEQASLRDKSGRLYSAFERQLVTMPASGLCDLLFEEDVISASSGKRTQRLIFRKRTA